MAEEAQRKIQSSMVEMVDDIDRSYLRSMQVSLMNNVHFLRPYAK